MKIKFDGATKGLSLFALLVTFPILMMYQNCSKVGVSDIPDGSGLIQSGNPGNPGCAAGDPTCNNNPGDPTDPKDPPPTCTTTITTTADNVKVFFLIDVSGSNRSGQGSVPATDPTTNGVLKPWRDGVLDKFLTDYLPKSNFSFQLGTFQGTTAKALIVDGANKTIFSNNSAVVRQAEQDFLKITDNDNTPYQAVLNMAAAAIKYDMGGATVPSSKYVVIMLTDGMPTDKAFSSGTDAQIKDNLRKAVAELVNVAPGYITFNTVLYYRSFSQKAEDYLTAMANAGAGLYNKADSSKLPFQIDDHVTVSVGTTDPVHCPVKM
jgi:hypothetical protein